MPFSVTPPSTTSRTFGIYPGSHEFNVGCGGCLYMYVDQQLPFHECGGVEMLAMENIVATVGGHNCYRRRVLLLLTLHGDATDAV